MVQLKIIERSVPLSNFTIAWKPRQSWQKNKVGSLPSYPTDAYKVVVYDLLANLKLWIKSSVFFHIKKVDHNSILRS